MSYALKQEGWLKKALQRVMAKKTSGSLYSFESFDKDKLIKELGSQKILGLLKQMLEIRHFEMRAEAAYLQGNIGGFFHAYTGQEAIQTACVEVLGKENWFSASYRCHAMALLLGVTPNDAMSEFFGRSNGNAQGRGGSMHLYSDRLLGGFGIVGGQVPIAIGAALTVQYQKKEKEMSICFLGDGACAQGVFYESLNIAKLWDLPCVFIVENNQWGMGTALDRAVAMKPIAQKLGDCFEMKHFTIDGMDLFSCYSGFEKIKLEMQQNRKPIIVEMVTERFKGHSVSDPGLYRSKEALKEAMQRDPILLLKQDLIDNGMLDEEGYKKLDKEIKDTMVAAIKHAENSPWPDPIELEEGVYDEE